MTRLIPGFRFHPSDVELVMYFLKRKVLRKTFCFDVIAEADIYNYSPWDLPDMSLLSSGDLEWYFFCPQRKKYTSGDRVNRSTEVGYWKATGRDKAIHHNKQSVGMIKTLVFHMGRPPKGQRTDWVMQEYRLEDNRLTDKGIQQDSYVLCKVYKKDGLGPRNGTQNGKSYNEEDWDNDDEEIEAVPQPTVSPTLPILTTSHNNSAIGSSSCLSRGILHPSDSGNKVNSNVVSQVPIHDDIPLLLDCFKEDSTLPLQSIKSFDNFGHQKDGGGIPNLAISNIFDGLGDLKNLAGLGEYGNGVWGQQAGYTTNQMLLRGDVSFVGSCDPNLLELLDLDILQDYL